MRLKPVMMNELVGGQHYLTIVVTETGQMYYMGSFVMRGKPFKKDGSWAINGSSYFRFAWDLGIDPATLHLTHNRVFRANTQNHQILDDLDNRNDVRGYLEAIGVENIESVINLMEVRMSEADVDFDEMMDDWFDHLDDIRNDELRLNG